MLPRTDFCGRVAAIYGLFSGLAEGAERDESEGDHWSHEPGPYLEKQAHRRRKVGPRVAYHEPEALGGWDQFWDLDRRNRRQDNDQGRVSAREQHPPYFPPVSFTQ